MSERRMNMVLTILLGIVSIVAIVLSGYVSAQRAALVVMDDELIECRMNLDAVETKEGK